MSINITYFVHGTTTDNEAGISSGWKDAELSELGRKQSIELKDKTQGQEFDAVFSSDLKRAVDSANLTFKDLAPIIIDERLRECNYGDFNGNPSEIVEPMQEKSIKTRFPNGESYEEVEERIQGFLSDIKKNYGGGNIAIVAHKAPQLALEVILNGKSWEEAFATDWRKVGIWRPGWKYILK